MKLYDYAPSGNGYKVRLLLAEKGITYDLVRESPWEMRDEFLDMNPAGDVQVLVEESGARIVHAGPICEYLDEAYPERALILGDAAEREACGNERAVALSDIMLPPSR